jgi:hypothetical protein
MVTPKGPRICGQVSSLSRQGASDTFHVFDRVIQIDEELHDGTRSDFYQVHLSQWQLTNLNQGYLLPVDFNAYEQHVERAVRSSSLDGTENIAPNYKTRLQPSRYVESSPGSAGEAAEV